MAKLIDADALIEALVLMKAQNTGFISEEEAQGHRLGICKAITEIKRQPDDSEPILAEAIALRARVAQLEAEQRNTWLSIVDLLVTELESEHGATHETWFIIEQAKALITKHREADQ